MDDLEINVLHETSKDQTIEVNDLQTEKDDSELTSECLDILIHPPADLPLPYGIDEKQTDLIFLDPSIGEGKRLVHDKTATMSQLFAVARQFINPVCGNIGLVVDEMVRRGIPINDVDSTSGMTILHYAVRAAAMTEKHALSVVKRLLSEGADPNQRSLYMDMNALHLAAYFDIPSAVGLLLKSREQWSSVAVDSLCGSFEYGTSLHIAASCLSCCAAEILLQKGACYCAKDDLGRTPEECIPTNLSTKEEKMKANHIKDLLHRYGKSKTMNKLDTKKGTKLTIGSCVEVTIRKSTASGKLTKTLFGTLRYLGSLPTSSAQWAGVELDTPDGKNDGSIGGSSYFVCKQDHGIFVPASHVVVVDKKGHSSRSKRSHRKQDVSCDFLVGERVIVAETKLGTVRFVGTTQFASGTWCGVELDERGQGRNDGSIGGVRYFTCDSSKGIFAPPSKLKRENPPESDATENDVTMDILRTPDTTPLSTPRGRRSKSHDRVTQPNLKTASKSAPSTPHVDRKRLSRSQSTTPSEKKTNYLKPDMQIELGATGQSATVKFIGTTDFASGLWVGLDLRSPIGKNDGSVKGKRYFTCSPKHGVMLRPSRVSRNGLNGDQLIPPHLVALKRDSK
uniref:CAP-Gly domain-containing linker protein 4-like n=1 Tax=Phallusia mammillata TaxID=59560 RepID=A0A6F9DAB4_9ASCI|nr:CAP-Gly domain-containing linker protein 4-like [Phallusia mammillata]